MPSEKDQLKLQTHLCVPELMTEDELIQFLRILEISKSDPHNAIENLKRARDLPRIHICHKTLFPLEAIREWINRETKSK